MEVGPGGEFADRANAYFGELPEPAAGGEDCPGPTGNPGRSGVHKLGQDPARGEAVV